jgi:hypothetical protein
MGAFGEIEGKSIRLNPRRQLQNQVSKPGSEVGVFALQGDEMATIPSKLLFLSKNGSQH